MENWLAILVTGFFTLGGAVIGAVISHYGIPRLGKSSTVFRTGSASEFGLLGKHFDGKYPIKLIETSFQNMHVVLSRDLASINGQATFKKGRDVIAAGEFRSSGVVSGGIAYCTYTVKDPNQQKKWYGVCVLSVPGIGDEIVGIWITEDTNEKGALAFGKMSLRK